MWSLSQNSGARWESSITLLKSVHHSWLILRLGSLVRKLLLLLFFFFVLNGLSCPFVVALPWSINRFGFFVLFVRDFLPLSLSVSLSFLNVFGRQSVQQTQYCVVKDAESILSRSSAYQLEVKRARARRRRLFGVADHVVFFYFRFP